LKNLVNLTHLAKGLRTRQTDAELALWSKLNNRQVAGFKFRRQQQITDYIVDFVCFEKKLIIELDGSQHSEEPFKAKDENKTRLFQNEGYEVLRFWDNDVLQNLDGITEAIVIAITKDNHPHLTSPVKGEE